MAVPVREVAIRQYLEATKSLWSEGPHSKVEWIPRFRGTPKFVLVIILPRDSEEVDGRKDCIREIEDVNVKGRRTLNRDLGVSNRLAR